MAKDWKEVLLRSGVPLEYEVARILANEGFNLQADFPYLRRDGGGDKEHSVDVLATWWGDGRDRKYKFAFHLVVECKHRARDKTLLLLPEPDVTMGTMIMGGTVHAYDEFVPYHLKGNCFVEFERDFPIAYKGIELHAGEAVERDFRRAIEQLRYAMPAVLWKGLDFCFCGHVSDAHAMFFARVVVTNAPMRLLHEDVDVAKIEAAKSIDEVSEEIVDAILVSDYGPDYERHFRNVLGAERGCLKDWSRVVEKYVKAEGKVLNRMSKPTRMMRDLLAGQRSECSDASTQFFVVHVSALAEVVQQMLECCKEWYRGRKKEKEDIQAGDVMLAATTTSSCPSARTR